MASGNGNCSPRPSTRATRCRGRQRPRCAAAAAASSSLRSMPVTSASVRVGQLRARPRQGRWPRRAPTLAPPSVDVVDHLSAPPAVLAKRQHRGEAVVASGQPGEQGRATAWRGSTGISVHAVPFG